MKKVLLKWMAAVSLLLCLSGESMAQPASTLWQTSVRYNCTTNLYEVYGRPTISRSLQSYILASTVTVVLPLNSNPLLQLTSLDFTSGPTVEYPRSLTNFNTRNPWSVTAEVLAPSGYFITVDNTNGGRFEPGPVSTNLSPFPIIGNKEYLLFTFGLTGGCVPGVRMWQAGVDLKIVDFSDWATTIVDQANVEQYASNYNNTGTTCTNGFDFGDLTSLWAAPKAGVISPDCDDNGIPDGNGGAVWAGNIVDAETTQKFSAQTNLANGDDLDNKSDEDGLTPPSVPLNLGYSYTFNVRLNSNQTGKQVFYGLWFDWNSDGNFNNDNATGTGPAFYSGSGVTASPVDISVFVKTPSVAGSGAGQANLASYKVRLIASDVAVTSGMFNGTFANGEVEDYQAPAQILPVTFGNVTAEAKNCNIYVAFDYLSQQNNKEFRIEYSGNGTNWKELALLPNIGNTGNRSFSYVHTTPSAGVNYYRIKQVDVDGNFSYSRTVSTVSTCAGGIKIVSYPNPVHATLTVVLPLNMGKAQLRVTDAAGKLIISNTTRSSFNTINTQLLASGMYMLEVVNAEKIVYTTKFVKE